MKKIIFLLALVSCYCTFNSNAQTVQFDSVRGYWYANIVAQPLPFLYNTPSLSRVHVSIQQFNGSAYFNWGLDYFDSTIMNYSVLISGTKQVPITNTSATILQGLQLLFTYVSDSINKVNIQYQ